jgi:hypothetical protein
VSNYLFPRSEKDHTLFEQAIQVAKVVEQTTDLSLLTDGERRYGNLLLDICHEVTRTGRPGRPKMTLPKGVKVRVKNKGSQTQKRGILCTHFTTKQIPAVALGILSSELSWLQLFSIQILPSN